METNLGIQTLLALLCNTTDQQGNIPVPFSADNAYILIGNANGNAPGAEGYVAPAPTDTNMTATTGVSSIAMVNNFPKISGQTVTFEIIAIGTVANFAWNEWAVANGTWNQISNSGSHFMLNHQALNLGTKTAGEVWTFQAQITQS